MVVMHHNRYAGASGGGNDRGRNQRQLAIGQQHLRRADDNRRTHLLGRLDGRLEHVGVGGIEQADRVMTLLRLL